MGLKLLPDDKKFAFCSPQDKVQSIVQTLAKARRSVSICHHCFWLCHMQLLVAL